MAIFPKRTTTEADTPQAKHKVNFEVDLTGKAYLKFPDGSIIYIGDNAPNVQTLINQVNQLNGTEIKILYFEVIDISATTTGTVTLPTGATISLEEFGDGQDAVLSTISGTGQPLFETPYTSGTAIGVTLDSNGDWSVSDNYPDDIAIIFAISISFENFSGIDPDNYLPLDETSFLFEKLLNKATDFLVKDNTKYPTTKAVDDYANANFQPLSTILNQISSLTGASNDDFIQKKSGEFTYRTPAQVAADLTANLLQGYQGITFQSGLISGNPANSTRYYCGSISSTNSLAVFEGRSAFVMPRPGVLKRVDVYVAASGGTGTGETSSVYFRLNATTDYLITSSIVTNNGVSVLARFTNDAMSVSVAKDAVFEFAWDTTPTGTIASGVRMQFIAYFD